MQVDCIRRSPAAASGVTQRRLTRQALTAAQHRDLGKTQWRMRGKRNAAYSTRHIRAAAVQQSRHAEVVAEAPVNAQQQDDLQDRLEELAESRPEQVLLFVRLELLRIKLKMLQLVSQAGDAPRGVLKVNEEAQSKDLQTTVFGSSLGAAAVEGTLAVLLAWWLHINPFAGIHWDSAEVGAALVLLLPILGLDALIAVPNWSRNNVPFFDAQAFIARDYYLQDDDDLAELHELLSSIDLLIDNWFVMRAADLKEDSKDLDLPQEDTEYLNKLLEMQVFLHDQLEQLAFEAEFDDDTGWGVGACSFAYTGVGTLTFFDGYEEYIDDSEEEEIIRKAIAIAQQRRQDQQSSAVHADERVDSSHPDSAATSSNHINHSNTNAESVLSNDRISEGGSDYRSSARHDDRDSTSGAHESGLEDQSGREARSASNGGAGSSQADAEGSDGGKPRSRAASALAMLTALGIDQKSPFAAKPQYDWLRSEAGSASSLQDPDELRRGTAQTAETSGVDEPVMLAFDELAKALNKERVINGSNAVYFDAPSATKPLGQAMAMLHFRRKQRDMFSQAPPWIVLPRLAVGWLGGEMLARGVVFSFISAWLLHRLFEAGFEDDVVLFGRDWLLRDVSQLLTVFTMVALSTVVDVSWSFVLPMYTVSGSVDDDDDDVNLDDVMDIDLEDDDEDYIIMAVDAETGESVIIDPHDDASVQTAPAIADALAITQIIGERFAINAVFAFTGNIATTYAMVAVRYLTLEASCAVARRNAATKDFVEDADSVLRCVRTKALQAMDDDF